MKDDTSLIWLNFKKTVTHTHTQSWGEIDDEGTEVAESQFLMLKNVVKMRKKCHELLQHVCVCVCSQ